MGPFPSAFIFWIFFNLIITGLNFFTVYDRFLFYPSKNMHEPVKIPGTDLQQLRFKLHNGNEICCWYYKKPDDGGLMLVSHGNGGNITRHARLAAHLLKDTSCSVLLYDYEGYGESQGKPSIKGILDDGVETFDYAVKDLGYSPDKIIIYGESLGCAVTCSIASERKPGGIILQSGFRSLPTIAKDTYSPLKVMPTFAFPEPRLDNEKLLKGEHGPLLILHGKRDEVIPFEHGEALYKVASEPKTFVALEHSGHNDTYVADEELFDRSISDFVKAVQTPK